jgi:hypothetical protein
VVAILQEPAAGHGLQEPYDSPLPQVGTGRRYLVFVRAGKESWHRQLILEDPHRNWDCCVSWSAPPEEVEMEGPAPSNSPEAMAEYYCSGAGFGNKLEDFLGFWKRRPRPWRYRYVILLDDDVYLRPGELSRFFTICDHYQLYLSQPALEWFTHTTLNALVRNPACVVRRVSLVEVMAPCFCTEALEDLVHTFDWTKSRWGIDWAWAGLAEGQRPLSVVDAVTMEHTRTGNGPRTAFYRNLLLQGIDPAEELRRVQRQFPAFAGSRTLRHGHVYQPGLSRWLAPAVTTLFERLKFIVRARKKFLRAWCSWRAGL